MGIIDRTTKQFIGLPITDRYISSLKAHLDSSLATIRTLFNLDGFYLTDDETEEEYIFYLDVMDVVVLEEGCIGIQPHIKKIKKGNLDASTQG